MQEYYIECKRCMGRYNIDANTLTEEQKSGKTAILNFVCPNIALMYRVLGFTFDFTVNTLNDDLDRFDENGKVIIDNVQKDIIENLKLQWGALDFENKLKRYKELNMAYMAVPEEYSQLIRKVISSYCMGDFYPSMTSACALGERILNRLVFKTKEHFKSSSYYRKFYGKQSSDNWALMTDALKEWQIISEEVALKFLILKKFRNDAIHYNENYDFEANTHIAVKTLMEIIVSQFDYSKRLDLFWAYDCPGEIWLRSNKINDPFVKEFILPNCMQLSPFDEPFLNPPFFAENVPLTPLTDEEFINMRNSRNIST